MGLRNGVEKHDLEVEKKELIEDLKELFENDKKSNQLKNLF